MRLLKILGILSVLIVASLFFFRSSSNSDTCAFCDDKVIERQMFYQDGYVQALFTHRPVQPGHILIIPKRHVERFEELNEEEMLAIQRALNKVHIAASKAFGTEAYLILQKNGKEVGQTVPHVHFHYIPRQSGDTSILPFLFSFYSAQLKSPLDEVQLREQIEQIQPFL